jgi:putative ABC transport system permease protein
MKHIAVALRLARRELRRGLSGFRIFLACLILGVASIAGVGSLSEALLEGLSRQGQQLLGGDVEVRLTQRELGKKEREWLAQNGKVSMVAELRAMAIAQGHDARALVELKAVDSAYPLYGMADVSPRQPLNELFANREGVFGAAADERLLAKLGIPQGGIVKIGNALFSLRGGIRREPDRVAGGFTLGPRVLISEFALRATGLVQPGSLINFNYRVALPESVTSREGVAQWVERLNDAFPNAGWQVRDRWNAAPGVRRFIEQAGAFLILVGLTALVIGGVGIGSAVKAYLDRRRDDIATLKCVGASGRFIFFMFLAEVMALAVIGVGVGLVLGVLLPFLAQAALAPILPFEAQFGLYLAPIGAAAAFGLVTAFAFAIWPLARAMETSPAVMFRDLVAPTRGWPKPAYVLATIAAFALLAALALLLTPNLRFAAGFAIGTAAAFALLRATAWGMMWLARHVPRPRFMMARLALSNIYRPGAPTPAVILSLGLGLTLLSAIALSDANIRRRMQEEIPAEAPSFFMVDIQPDQAKTIAKLVKDAKGVSEFDMVPMVRGRIVKLKDTPADKAVVARDAKWALNGDRGITYGNPEDARKQVVEGRWWPENYKAGRDGPPLVSFATDLAKGLGLKVGDMITVNVLGRDIPLQIANLRLVDFSNARMNFIMIVSPGVLETAPHSNLATARITRDHEDDVERLVTNKYPNVSIVRVREALETANDLVQQLAGGIRAASFVTLLTGLLVLAGALAAGHRHRLFDAVVLKVMGATKGQVMTTYLIEFAALGAGAGFVAAIVGTVAAWAVAWFLMESSFVPSMSTLVAVVVGGAIAAMALGIAATWTALSTPAARTLRTA